ncbi:MAG: Holliday junction branch migration DNA helicase RuvB [Candidatus Wildermuthbacteria bacterium]|nr:Holliday junction branch migration DNA helicase RuvB [Candidatus Wildermuthbacteria bacterium]
MFVNSQPQAQEEDEVLDSSLRPKGWSDYIGQRHITDNLKIIIEAAKKRKEPIEHLLFYGNSGLGKTTLAHVVSNELGSRIHVCSAPSVERAGDLASILTNLEEGDVLFLDECHRLHAPIMEMLYSAMEDFRLHLIVGKGPMARTMDIDLPKFSLIGATTRPASLPSPLRNRFGAVFQFDFYAQEDIERILARSASLLQVDILPEALSFVASRSRFTPRVANRLLKRARDFASIQNTAVTKEIAEYELSALGIDSLGLEPGDRRILETLISKFNGGPVGIQTLAAATQEEEDTILDMYEPYLLQLGFLERTPRGRMATKSAHSHLSLQRHDSKLL